MKQILFICLLFTGFSFAQEQTIMFGKTELKLGADQETVLDLLDELYFVEYDQKNEYLFLIWDTEKRNYFYGTIEFDNLNKLISISKNWSNAVNDSHSQLFEQLFKLIDNYKSDGNIKVKTQEIFEPNYKAKTLSFMLNNKTIELTITGNRITLKELLKENK